MNDELWRWDACDLARSICARLVTSRDATESCLRRLEQVNPRINAVVDVLADEALAAADLAIARLREANRWGSSTASQ